MLSQLFLLDTLLLLHDFSEVNIFQFECEIGELLDLINGFFLSL